MKPVERHISAGPGALGALGGALGLGAGEKSWSLDGACALGREAPRVRLSLKSGAHRLVVYLLARSSTEAVVRAPGLSLSAKGAAGPAVEKLLKVFAARLGERTLEDVVKTLEADPWSFTENVTPGQDGDKVKVPCIGQPMALLEAGWRNFYADQDFEVLLGVPSCSSDKTINIEYADLECYYARPRRSFTKWSFMDWPEESENGGGEAEGEAPREGSIVTELEERDMV
ncbi:MAG: hypothetical protein NUW21_05805, partial [Elusimicrobia bacterium]|nr:hypothetical protein [Elusimicrobiota bacterium]